MRECKKRIWQWWLMKMISRWWTQLLEKTRRRSKRIRLETPSPQPSHANREVESVGEPTNMVASLANKATVTGTVDQHNEERNKPSTSRKRKRNEDAWKRNIQKRLRNREEYRTSKGKAIPARHMKAGRGDRCRYRSRCQKLFDQTWHLGDTTLQRDFTAKTVSRIPLKQRVNSKDHSRRNWTYEYYFQIMSNKTKVKVQVYSLVSSEKRHSPDFTQLPLVTGPVHS